MTDARAFITDELPRLLELLRGTDVSELAVDEDGVSFRIRRSPGPGELEDVAGGIEAIPVVEDVPAAVEVTAPLVGTFYRAENPGAPPLVEAGSHVESDTVVGIIEALQVLTEVEAGCSGVIATVLATDGLAVQYGQPLFEVTLGD